MMLEDNKSTQDKLMLLYLIDKMDLSLSRGQIGDYMIQNDFMDYYTIQQELADMTEKGYLEAIPHNTQTRFAITEEGLKILEYFEKHLPITLRAKINQFVKEKRGEMKREFETTATFIPSASGDEFMVKCEAYEEERVLMQISISVDTRDQARIIQNNWNSNAKNLYGEIIRTLAKTVPQEEKDSEATV